MSEERKELEHLLHSLLREQERFRDMFIENAGKINVWFKADGSSMRVRNEVTVLRMIEAYENSLRREIRGIRVMLG